MPTTVSRVSRTIRRLGLCAAAFLWCLPAWPGPGLPPINFDAWPQGFVAPASMASETAVLRGKTFDLVSRQPVSRQEGEALRGLFSGTFDRELTYAQASRMVPVVHDAFAALGYSKPRVIMEARASGHPCIAVELSGGWQKPGKADLSRLAPAVEMASRDYYTTSEGAAMRSLGPESNSPFLKAAPPRSPAVPSAPGSLPSFKAPAPAPASAGLETDAKDLPASATSKAGVSAAHASLPSAATSAAQGLAKGGVDGKEKASSLLAGNNSLSASKDPVKAEGEAAQARAKASVPGFGADDPSSPEGRAEAMLKAAGEKAQKARAGEIVATARTAVSYAQGYAQAQDKAAFMKAAASNWASSQANDYIASLLEGYKGVNAQIDFGLSQLETLNPSGKILVPFVNKPKYVVFGQGGAVQAQQDRTIVHAGLGARFYPEALSKSQSGSYMLGVNTVLDLDVSRGHKRMSFGGEFMTDKLFLAANWYQRLTGWKHSPDFSSGMVEERPANGFDLRFKGFLPRRAGLGRLAATGSVTHWIGNDIAPFGNHDDLENDPWIYEAGLEWQPVPAITASVKHAVTDGGHSNTSVNLGFSIPLGAVDLPRAFDPDADNLASGMNVNESRSMFITRDYLMPLQYRAEPGKFSIRYCGLSGSDRHCFEVRDGLGRPAEGAVVRVTPSDKCVKLSNGGVYTADISGRFYVQVLSSCTPRTKITVKAGDSELTIDIEMRKLDLSIAASPASIPRYKHSIVTLSGLPDSAGVPVSWSLSGAGALLAASKAIGSDGKATAEFAPDANASADYTASVTATVNGTKYSAPVLVRIYGGGSGDSPIKFNLGGRDCIEGNEVLELSYPGLEPGAEIKWTASDDGKLCLGDDGSDEGNSFSSTVDADGVAVMHVKASDVDSGTIEITAQTPDGNLSSAMASVNVKSFIATASAPQYTAAGDNFTLKLSGLKPGTSVSWAEALFAKPASVSSTAGGDGTASMQYTTIADAYSGKITGIKATYYRNVAATSVADFPDILLTEYLPSISAFPDDFSGNDSFTLTVSGVKPGFPVAWAVKSGTVQLFDAEEKASDSGEATATVTGVDPYAGGVEISATAMGREVVSSGSYHSWDPVISVAQKVAYKESSLVALSGLKPGSVAKLSVDSSSVQLAETELTADADGNARTTAYGVTDEAVTSFTVSAEVLVNSAQTKVISGTTGIYQLSLSAGKTQLDGYADDAQTLDSTLATVSGGEPGATVTWKIEGDGSLSSVQTVFDDSGKATAVVNAKSPFTTAPAVTVEAMGTSKSISFTYKLTTYTPTVVMPTFTSLYAKTTNLDYGKKWTMKVRNLLPKSKVTVSSAAVGTVTAKADETGTATFEDMKEQTAAGTVKVNYLSSGITYADTTASYTVASYPLSISSAKASLDAFGGSASSPDSSTITITGGQPGATLGWGVSGDATLSSTATTFDSAGNATAVVNSKASYAASPTISGTSLDQATSMVLPYSLTTYAPQFHLPSFTSIYSRTTTLDYQGGAWGFTVSGLLPGSTASITGPASQSVTVGSDGVATFSNLPQQTAGGTITLTYRKSGVTDATATANYSVASYPLTMTTDKSEIYGNETFTATVTGGKPGAAVSWSISGSGQYTAKASNFNAQGVATASVQGIDPYSVDITASAASLSGSVSRAVLFTFPDLSVSKVDQYTCNGTEISFQAKTYEWQIMGWPLVRKAEVHFWGNADDYGEIEVNGTHWRPAVYKTEIPSEGPSHRYFDETRTISIVMSGPQLVVKVGTNNEKPSFCYFEGGFTIKLMK